MKTQRIFIAIWMFAYSSCTPELSDDPIPYLPFSDVKINLNLPEYIDLSTDGGWMYINDAGVRGVIVYRKDEHTYIAFERNCSFQPNNACATVDVHSSNLYMSDACCESSFSFVSGSPTGGPAWRPLNQYVTLLDNSELIITDELVN